MSSFVAVTGRNESSCGYCHSNADTSISFGAWAYAMSCADYQALIDRGWRRSGKYLYKPTTEATCCPPYTIRLEVGKFEWSRSHKKVIKKVRGWVKNGAGDQKRGRKVHGEGQQSDSVHETEASGQSIGAMDSDEEEDGNAGNAQPPPQEGLQEPAVEPPAAPPLEHTETRKDEREPHSTTKNVDIAMQDASSSSPPAKSPNSAKSGKVKSPKKKPAAPTTPLSKSDQFLAMIRDAETSSGKAEGHELKIVLERATYQEETYQLFRKYQIAIHHDPPTKLSPSKYRQFLVDSPLTFEPPQTLSTPGYGSFHQKYYADGKLIATGVIDILPHCVSSVYFMYDPDYAFLSPGVYSALREVGFTMLLNDQLPELKYYYMGECWSSV
ncbi:Arginyl-tRNA--protein transferase 1 [Rhizophlyctis rosea]|nr:Arginyl-tRNA--protein transferase 1 [Rhizophlyctis rosea]